MGEDQSYIGRAVLFALVLAPYIYFFALWYQNRNKK